MAVLTAQRSVNTRDLPELEKIKDSAYEPFLQEGQYANDTVPPDHAAATFYRFNPFEIDLISSVNGAPADLDWNNTVGSFAGTFRRIDVRDIAGSTTSQAYSITGFSAELDTDLFSDAQDGKLHSFPAKIFQGDDELNGSPFADILFAFAGDDVVNGGGGDDQMDGGDGDDQLSGSDGNDQIDGDKNDDRLTGGLGADVQTGGLGADTFYFVVLTDSTKKASGRDTILDFSRIETDEIDLSAIDAKTGGSNPDNDFKFIKKNGFHEKKGELRYKVKNSGDSLVQGDVDGRRQGRLRHTG